MVWLLWLIIDKVGVGQLNNKDAVGSNKKALVMLINMNVYLVVMSVCCYVIITSSLYHIITIFIKFT